MSVAEAPARSGTAVLVCDDGLRRKGDAAGLGAVLVPRLCREPERIGELADGAARLVLGLCATRFSLGPVQREARRAGFDPLGVEIVDLDAAGGDPGRLSVLLAAAVARAGAFAGSRPEHAKLTFPAQTSRRALLTFALPEYVAAPDVDPTRCAADRGCRACVTVCPQGAISFANGRIAHDRNVCEPCGRCVTACPTGATENPAATAAQVEAQVRALLRAPGDGRGGPPRGIVYRCRRATRVETAPGWFPVTVPCTAMVTEGWLLAPLVLGAGSVAVRTCTDGGCSLAQDAVVLERVEWCRRFLTAMVVPAGRMSLDPDAAPPAGAPPAQAVSDPFGPVGAAGVLLALADAAGVDEIDTRTGMSTAGGSIGVVDIDPGVCTGCGTCAASCPTGALQASDDAGWRSLSFDANLCVACGTCTSRCPEGGRGAITLRPLVDLSRLRQGRTVASTSELVACRSCGAPVAPAALLARIEDLVGDERVLNALRRCQDCRSLPVGA